MGFDDTCGLGPAQPSWFFFFNSRVGSLVVVFLRVLSSLSGSMCSSCGGTNLEKSLRVDFFFE